MEAAPPVESSLREIPVPASERRGSSYASRTEEVVVDLTPLIESA